MSAGVLQPEVVGAGVDTLSHAWYVGGSERVADWFADDERTYRGAAGSRILKDKAHGMTVGYFEGPQMVFAEGHASQEDGGLANTAQLQQAVAALEDYLCRAGFPMSPEDLASDNFGMAQGTLASATIGRAGLRRLDATINLAMPTQEQGTMLLCAIAAILRNSPGKCSVIYGPDARPETGYWLGYAGKEKLGRWYDKGLESPRLGIGRGRLIRSEAQRRFDVGTRPDVFRNVDDEWVAQRYQRRFRTVWQSVRGVTVSGEMPIMSKLVDLVAAGELTERQATTLAGHLALSRVGGLTATGTSRTTSWRRDTKLRDLGIVYGDGVLEECEINLEDVCEQILGTDLWGAEG